MSLTSYDLESVFECAVDLARATARFRPEDYAEPSGESGRRERSRPWHHALDAIETASCRLQRALGAQGPLDAGDLLREWSANGSDADASPTWLAYRDSFKYAKHSEAVIQALNKLALGATHLRGFASVSDSPLELWEPGLRLLRWGLAQLWMGMAAGEQDAVRARLADASAAVGWPTDPTQPPPLYDGPREVQAGDRPTNIDLSIGFASRTRECAAEARRLERELAAAPEDYAVADDGRKAVPATASCSGPGVTWQEARDRMERFRAQGEAFTSQRKLGTRIGCPLSTINKAIHSTPTLKTWAKRPTADAPRALSISDVVTDRTAQRREMDPAEDAAIREFIEQADPQTKGWFLALSIEDQLDYLNDSDKHGKILGRHP